MGGMFGGGGGGNVPVAQPGPNVMQPSPVPGSGLPPVAPQVNMPASAAPNLGAPAVPPPQLAPGVTLPAQKPNPAAGARMIAMGKALQAISNRQPQQPQPRGTPVNFNYQPAPFVSPPIARGNGG